VQIAGCTKHDFAALDRKVGLLLNLSGGVRLRKRTDEKRRCAFKGSCPRSMETISFGDICVKDNDRANALTNKLTHVKRQFFTVKSTKQRTKHSEQHFNEETFLL